MDYKSNLSLSLSHFTTFLFHAFVSLLDLLSLLHRTAGLQQNLSLTLAKITCVLFKSIPNQTAQKLNPFSYLPQTFHFTLNHSRPRKLSFSIAITLKKPKCHDCIFLHVYPTIFMHSMSTHSKKPIHLLLSCKKIHFTITCTPHFVNKGTKKIPRFPSKFNKPINGNACKVPTLHPRALYLSSSTIILFIIIINVFFLQCYYCSSFFLSGSDKASRNS